jgi:hypothetical protein
MASHFVRPNFLEPRLGLQRCSRLSVTAVTGKGKIAEMVGAVRQSPIAVQYTDSEQPEPRKPRRKSLRRSRTAP